MIILNFFEEICPFKILSLGLGNSEFADYAHKRFSGADIDFVSPSNINDDYFNSLYSKNKFIYYLKSAGTTISQILNRNGDFFKVISIRRIERTIIYIYNKYIILH